MAVKEFFQSADAVENIFPSGSPRSEIRFGVVPSFAGMIVAEFRSLRRNRGAAPAYQGCHDALKWPKPIGNSSHDP